MSKSYVWDLSELYSGLDDPRIEADLQAAEAATDAFVAKWGKRTDYLKQPAVLREVLDEINATEQNLGTGDRVAYYLGLRWAIDQNNAKLSGQNALVSKRRTEMNNRIRFFYLNLGKIKPATQKVMLASPELEPYREWLKQRFEFAKYDLPVEANNALSHVLPQAGGAWEDMVEKLLSGSSARVFDGEKVRKVPFNELPGLLSSSDPRVVKEAGAAMTRIQKRWATVAENEINAIISTNLRLNKFRGYDRPDTRSFMGNDLNADVVDGMLKAIGDNAYLAHRVYDLKARLMGKDVFAYHERVATYGSVPEGFTFEEACDRLRDTLNKLHPDFVVEFNHALAHGRIDAEPRLGKRGGAACWHGLIGHPPYLLLSYSGTLDSIQTLAHEFGHYLNNRHMQDGGLCDAFTYGSPTPLAEVTSTFFEKYILEPVLNDADEETRLAILVTMCEDQLATIFRQAAATRFEQELYARIDAEGYLSYKEIGKLFSKHMSSYLGPRVSMADGADLWWIYWGHFRAEFYNYGYTFAQLVAMALQTRVDADPGYIDEFRRLLRTGSSLPTPKLLESMGLNVADGSIWRAGLDQFETLLNEAENLAEKLGKI